MNKKLACLFSLLITSSAFAVPVDNFDNLTLVQNDIPFSGFYIGLYGGVIAAGFELEQSAQTPPVIVSGNPYLIATLSDDIFDVSGVGGIDLGGGFRMQDFFLGAELRGDASGAKENNVASIQTFFLGTTTQAQAMQSVSYRGSASAVVRLGYITMENNVLFYLLGGGIGGSFSYSINGTFSQVGGLNVSRTFSTNEKKGGGLVGVGVEVLAAPSLGIKLEYNYANFGTITFNNLTLPVTILGATANFAILNQVQPKINTFVIGINWHFV